MKKIFCFEELLLRISPAANTELAERPMLVYVGGTEANVATAPAGWSSPLKYCTALVDIFLSRHVFPSLEYNDYQIKNTKPPIIL